MTDTRLRTLERRWQESGATEILGALLRERLRAGLVPRWRLELAALCQHEAARLALGALSFGEELALLDWVDALSARALQDRGVFVRLGVALSRALRPLWEGHAQVRATFAALEDWLRCPCGGHREEVVRLAGECRPPWVPWWEHDGLREEPPAPLGPGGELVCGTALFLQRERELTGKELRRRRELGSRWRDQLEWALRPRWGWEEEPRELAQASQGQPVLLSVRRRVSAELARGLTAEVER